MLSTSVSRLGLITAVVAAAAMVTGCPPTTPPTTTATVPNLVGLTESAAQIALADAGLTVGTVSDVYSATVPEGVVISQNPTAGATMVQGATVNIVVSLGPDPGVPPDGEPTETTTLPGGVPLEMVLISGATYPMGRYLDEQDGSSYEDPQHSVTLSAFWIGRYEITQAQFQAVMGWNPSLNPAPDHPVENVSWDNAKAFAQALKDQTGKDFRLPSEAQWEYACRAASKTRFYWGDDPNNGDIGVHAWYGGNSNGGTQKVGQKLPNTLGLYDMSGNVAEWCEDDWHASYDGAPTGGSAWVDAPRGAYRVYRGGGWESNPNQCRSAYRNRLATTAKYRDLGFRVVLPAAR